MFNLQAFVLTTAQPSRGYCAIKPISGATRAINLVVRFYIEGFGLGLLAVVNRERCGRYGEDRTVCAVRMVFTEPRPLPAKTYARLSVFARRGEAPRGRLSAFC